MLLKAPMLGIPEDLLNLLDSQTNGELRWLQSERNKVVHAGHNPKGIDMGRADKVVHTLLSNFLFSEEWAKDWAMQPAKASVSAVSLHALLNQLQVWVG